MTLREFIENIENVEQEKEPLEEGLRIFKLSERLEKAIMRVEKKKSPEGADPEKIKKCINDLKRFKKNAMMIENKYENGSLTRANAKKQVKRLLAQVRVFSKSAQDKFDVKILKRTGLTIAISAAIIIAVGLAVYFGVAGNINLNALGSDVTKIFGEIKTAGMEAAKAAPGTIKDTAAGAGAVIGGAAKSAADAAGSAAKSAGAAVGAAAKTAGESETAGSIKGILSKASGFFRDLWIKGPKAVQALFEEEGAMDKFWRSTKEAAKEVGSSAQEAGERGREALERGKAAGQRGRDAVGAAVDSVRNKLNNKE